MKLEEEFYGQGYKSIACIDEVGRGCLCGDVVACAIIMGRESSIEEIRDSKKLTAKKREELYPIILEECIAVGIGRVDNNIIDDINIKQATRLAMKKAVLDLHDRNRNGIDPDLLLIDAEDIDLNIDQRSIIKGDEKSYGISCASIVAKVFRDNLCQDWEEKYPGYNIKQNKGYGTKEHREAILELGPSKIHRMSFLGKLLNK